MSETADKNTFAGALAQESSHYVTLGNSTIPPSICQQFFPSFSIFFSNKKNVSSHRACSAPDLRI